MNFTFRIPKATETHLEYVILVACLRQQQLLRERASVTFIQTLSVLLPIKSQGLDLSRPLRRMVYELFQSRRWKLLSKKHVMFNFVLIVNNASGHPTNLKVSTINVKNLSLALYINPVLQPMDEWYVYGNVCKLCGWYGKSWRIGFSWPRPGHPSGSFFFCPRSLGEWKVLLWQVSRAVTELSFCVLLTGARRGERSVWTNSRLECKFIAGLFGVFLIMDYLLRSAVFRLC